MSTLPAPATEERIAAWEVFEAITNAGFLHEVAAAHLVGIIEGAILNRTITGLAAHEQNVKLRARIGELEHHRSEWKSDNARLRECIREFKVAMSFVTGLRPGSENAFHRATELAEQLSLPPTQKAA